jgi:hypothetical protein
LGSTGAVLPELAEAERALAAGDYQTAIHVARHTLQTRLTSEAYAVIAIGYCGLRDLSNAKAALRQVHGLGVLRVHRRCAALGLPITE